MDEDRARDLDETRRLLYMLLVFNRTPKYELAGTVINALKHHQGVDPDPNADPGHASDLLISRVVDYLDGDGDEDMWISEQIKEILAKLGQHADE